MPGFHFHSGGVEVRQACTFVPSCLPPCTHFSTVNRLQPSSAVRDTWLWHHATRDGGLTSRHTVTLVLSRCDCETVCMSSKRLRGMRGQQRCPESPVCLLFVLGLGMLGSYLGPGDLAGSGHQAWAARQPRYNLPDHAAMVSVGRHPVPPRSSHHTERTGAQTCHRPGLTPVRPVQPVQSKTTPPH